MPKNNKGEKKNCKQIVFEKEKKLVQKMCPTCPFDRVGERESKAIWAMSTYTDHISKSGITNVWFGLVDIIWVVWFCIVKY